MPARPRILPKYLALFLLSEMTPALSSVGQQLIPHAGKQLVHFGLRCPLIVDWLVKAWTGRSSRGRATGAGGGQSKHQATKQRVLERIFDKLSGPRAPDLIEPRYWRCAWCGRARCLLLRAASKKECVC